MTTTVFFVLCKNKNYTIPNIKMKKKTTSKKPPQNPKKSPRIYAN